MLRSVVAVPGASSPAIPETLCCASGQEFGAGPHGRAADGLKVQWRGRIRYPAPIYRFPLCDACARARNAWERFPLVGIGLGLLAGVALAIDAFVAGQLDATLLQDVVSAIVERW